MSYAFLIKVNVGCVPRTVFGFLEVTAPERQLYIGILYINTFANLIFVSGMERSGFPETPILLGFGKSYLIPETTI